MTKKKFFEMLAGATHKPKGIGAEDHTLQGRDRVQHTAVVVYWYGTFDRTTVKVVRGKADLALIQKYQAWVEEYRAQAV